MAEIIPAILPKSYAEVEEKLSLVASYAPKVQIDICDGLFVPSRTWPYLKNVPDQIFEELVEQSKAFPHWDEIDFEFDLMCRDAVNKIPDFIAAGASAIIVHKSSVTDEELDAIVADYGKNSDNMGPFGIELGLAVGNDSTVAEIAPFADKVHFIQIMGIDKIGFQGQEFNPRTVELVAALRQAYPELIISIDGGVNLDTARDLVEAGADRLVVGSALFGAGSVLEALDEFKAL